MADDITAAYWLARCGTASGQQGQIPDWLLACVQGARWLEDEQDPLVHELFDIASSHTPGDALHLDLLALSASLWPSLVAPTAGLVDWLRTPVVCPAIRPLVEATRAFAGVGLGVQPEHLRGLAGEELRRARIGQAAADAKLWLENAASRKTKYARGTDVLRRLVNVEFSDLLSEVVANDGSRASTVRSKLKSWETNVDDRVHDIARLVHGAQGEPIVGSPRNVILAAIQEACDLATRWCDLVRNEELIRARGSWLDEQVAELRGHAKGAVLPAIGELCLVTESDDELVAGASACLAWTLRLLAERLHLDLPRSDQPTVSPALARRPAGDNLTRLLARRLLWVPSIRLDANGVPPAEELGGLRKTLTSDPHISNPDLAEAFEGRLALEDYGHGEELLAFADAPEQRAKLSARLDAQRAAANVDLSQCVSKATVLIEEALFDGYFGEGERAASLSTLAGISSEKSDNMALARSELRRLEREIHEARETRWSEQRRRWSLAQRELTAADWLPPERQAALIDRVEKALDVGDVRVTDELLSHVDQALADRQDVPATWFEQSVRSVAFRDFADSRMQSCLLRLNKDGLRDLASKLHHRKPLPEPFGVPDGQTLDVASTYDSWLELKRASRINGNASHLSRVLRYLGFELTDQQRDIQIEKETKDVTRLRVSMSAGRVSPVPQFGSLAGKHYRVDCVWDRSGTESVASTIRESHSHTIPTIVLYFGRLAREDRNELSLISQQCDLPAVVLDEHLLVFLSRETGSRLPAFLRCSLPFSPVHPYAPFKAGDVPSEMFFGREEMANEVARPEGSCIVYGGAFIERSRFSFRECGRNCIYPLIARDADMTADILPCDRSRASRYRL